MANSTSQTGVHFVSASEKTACMADTDSRENSLRYLRFVMLLSIRVDKLRIFGFGRALSASFWTRMTWRMANCQRFRVLIFAQWSLSGTQSPCGIMAVDVLSRYASFDSVHRQ